MSVAGSFPQAHVERVEGKVGAQRGGQLPADDAAAEDVDDEGCIDPAGKGAAVGDVEIAVAEYIDWFNHRRLHGEIGLIPPAEFETNHWANTEVQHYPEIPVLTKVGSN